MYSSPVIVPRQFEQVPGTVLVVEGASCVAACLSMGIAAIGRPTNRSARYIANYLRGREFIVVGEMDAKSSGAWPGRDGAEAVAKVLANELGRDIRWALPPDGAKDARSFVNGRKLDVRLKYEWRALGSPRQQSLHANFGASCPSQAALVSISVFISCRRIFSRKASIQ